MKLGARNKLKAAVIGKDGRTSAIQRHLEASPRIHGPVEPLVSGKPPDAATMLKEVCENARLIKPDFAVVGPEEPLAYGVVDELQDMGIPCVGPVRALARLESSKAFARELLRTCQIPGNPDYRVFSGMPGVSQYLETLGNFVIKPDGLTGGKGVKLSGDHLGSVEEALAYCEELFAAGQERIVVEEKLDGEEFSLQSFSDGYQVVHTVPVQDHKRAHDGDVGPNTGGMGSYSDANGLLPFLSRADLTQAQRINEDVVRAVRQTTGLAYRGVLFGGFMLTKGGIRLLEYNVRFGDPEALNVLSLVKNDFAEVCIQIIDGTLDQVAFTNLATVCKYVVPNGYPSAPERGSIGLDRMPPESTHLKVFHSAIQKRPDGRFDLMGSRSLAVVGLGATISEAYSHAEAAAASVDGPVFHRKDIGSDALIQKRVRHMQQVQHRVAV
jgi:phosphoribosylamine--glycine ligase